MGFYTSDRFASVSASGTDWRDTSKKVLETSSKFADKAASRGVKYFEEEANALWKEIVEKNTLTNQGPTVEKILKENEQNKQAFVEISKNLSESSISKKESPFLSSGLSDWSNAMDSLGRGGKSFVDAEEARKEEAATLGRGGK